MSEGKCYGLTTARISDMLGKKRLFTFIINTFADVELKTDNSWLQMVLKNEVFFKKGYMSDIPESSHPKCSHRKNP